MAWTADGKTLYLARDKKLEAYDPIKKKFKSVTSKLPKGTEALDVLPDGLLLGGARDKASTSLFTFNPTTKQLVTQRPLVAAAGATLGSVEGLAVLSEGSDLP